MLSDTEKKEIICDFPNIKLSYENIVHKKVSNYDIILAIPDGKKCFAWFTTHNNKNVCFVMEIGQNKGLENIKIATCSFNSELSYGTILYGTTFYYKNNNFFSIEDVFYYKSKNVSTYNWNSKFELFGKLMKHDIRQVAYNKSFLVFGLPIMSKTCYDIKEKINNVNYRINCYQFRSFHKKNVSEYILLKDINNNQPVETKCDINLSHTTISYSNKNKKINMPTTFKHITKREIVFKIKPDIQNDIYHLYALNNGSEIYYDVAYIPDFVTSVMMNKLFRNIKENQNLDALEESDDEDEFENDKEDRFVFLDKSYNMICAYNNKFKKWYPIRIADDNMVIVNINQLNNL
jgi:hypothetical protein